MLDTPLIQALDSLWVILPGLFLVLAVIWLILPFAFFGMKSLLRAQRDEQREHLQGLLTLIAEVRTTNTLLQQVIDQERSDGESATARPVVKREKSA